jgi:hypothetical protein
VRSIENGNNLTVKMGEVQREMEETIAQFQQIPVYSSIAGQSVDGTGSVAISRRNGSLMSLNYGSNVRDSI